MISVTVSGFRDFDRQLRKAPKVATRVASQTINTAARRALAMSRKAVVEQVNLKKGYVNANLTQTSSASRNNLRATLTGRRRPSLLSRYTTGWAVRGRNKATGNVYRHSAKVRIKPNAPAKVLKRSFAMELKNNNLGVVVRTDGAKPEAAYNPMPLYKGQSSLWLLYGPSVDQVFKTVRVDIQPEVEQFMAVEFDRNFRRLMQ